MVFIDADWYSFLGNAASILGFVASVFSLYLTFLVKRQVGRIEAEYALRLQSGQWIVQINDHIDSLSESLNPFDLNKARLALTKANALIEAMAEQTPAPLAAQGRKLSAEITSSLKTTWIGRKIRLDADKAFELYLHISGFSENVQHSVSKSQNRPIR